MVKNEYLNHDAMYSFIKELGFDDLNDAMDEVQLKWLDHVLYTKKGSTYVDYSSEKWSCETLVHDGLVIGSYADTTLYQVDLDTGAFAFNFKAFIVTDKYNKYQDGVPSYYSINVFKEGCANHGIILKAKNLANVLATLYKTALVPDVTEVFGDKDALNEKCSYSIFDLDDDELFAFRVLNMLIDVTIDGDSYEVTRRDEVLPRALTSKKLTNIGKRLRTQAIDPEDVVLKDGDLVLPYIGSTFEVKSDDVIVGETTIRARGSDVERTKYFVERDLLVLELNWCNKTPSVRTSTGRNTKPDDRLARFNRV